jgi:Uncharacterised protein family (UPF0175)
MAVEAYRAHHLTGSQFRRLLGSVSRYELDAFLKERGVWLEYTLKDFSGAKVRSPRPRWRSGPKRASINSLPGCRLLR